MKIRMEWAALRGVIIPSPAATDKRGIAAAHVHPKQAYQTIFAILPPCSLDFGSRLQQIISRHPTWHPIAPTLSRSEFQMSGYRVYQELQACPAYRRHGNSIYDCGSKLY
jgi:hypothetical protein